MLHHFVPNPKFRPLATWTSSKSLHVFSKDYCPIGMVITNKENTSQNDPINVLVAHEQKHKNAACICSFSRSRNLLVDCFRSQGWVLWLRVTMFPNRGLCERFLPIFKILVSHNLFSVTNNIQSYLLEELNVIDVIVYKADRWHTS